MTQIDNKFMQRAISLAQRGKGRVHPNPLVGCVLVKNRRIIAEGYHSEFGGPHAELIALKKAGRLARGASLYVNLEPCAHWGKTPPCAPALIQAGVKKVYVAHRDPNPKVNGRGLEFLRRNGINVTTGLEEVAARRLNQPFLTWITKNRPYTILKMAMSLDGKIASRGGDSKWISSPLSRKLVHKLRSESDAVLIGANAAQIDNPHLTSHGMGRDPIRIVIDPHLKLPPNLKIFRNKTGRTWILTSAKAAKQRARFHSHTRARILPSEFNNGGLDLKKTLRNLAKINVSQLFIEGGGETAWAFISQGFVDEVLFFIAPILVGGRTAISPLEGSGFLKIRQAKRLHSLSVIRIGDDTLIRGFLN